MSQSPDLYKRDQVSHLTTYEMIAQQCAERLNKGLSTSNCIVSPSTWENLRTILTATHHPNYHVTAEGCTGWMVALDVVMCGTTVGILAVNMPDDEFVWSTKDPTD